MPHSNFVSTSLDIFGCGLTMIFKFMFGMKSGVRELAQ
jgi:hypothetical protein